MVAVAAGKRIGLGGFVQRGHAPISSGIHRWCWRCPPREISSSKSWDGFTAFPSACCIVTWRIHAGRAGSTSLTMISWHAQHYRLKVYVVIKTGPNRNPKWVDGESFVQEAGQVFAYDNTRMLTLLFITKASDAQDHAYVYHPGAIEDNRSPRCVPADGTSAMSSSARRLPLGVICTRRNYGYRLGSIW